MEQKEQGRERKSETGIQTCKAVAVPSNPWGDFVTAPFFLLDDPLLQ